MATYTIIGGDNKEYGPISAEDVRQWIKEGRLNPQTSIKSDTDTQWRTLGALPEFADVLQPATPPPIGPLTGAAPPNAGGNPMGFLERDYDLDIGGCVSRGWATLKENFGLLFVGSLMLFIIAAVVSGGINMVVGQIITQTNSEIVLQIVNFVSVTLLALVNAPLTAGLYRMNILALRRQPANFEHLFSGFGPQYLNLVLGNLIMVWINTLCTIPFRYAYDQRVPPLLQKLQHAQPNEAQQQLAEMLNAMASTVPLLLVCMIPVLYFTISLQFALPLIIDKQIGAMTAIKAAWKMVHRHWWYVLGMTLVAGLISVVGVLGCCIGILFTIPIGIAAMMAAYEIIFGAGKE